MCLLQSLLGFRAEVCKVSVFLISSTQKASTKPCWNELGVTVNKSVGMKLNNGYFNTYLRLVLNGLWSTQNSYLEKVPKRECMAFWSTTSIPLYGWFELQLEIINPQQRHKIAPGEETVSLNTWGRDRAFPCTQSLRYCTQCSGVHWAFWWVDDDVSLYN